MDVSFTVRLLTIRKKNNFICNEKIIKIQSSKKIYYQRTMKTEMVNITVHNSIHIENISYYLKFTSQTIMEVINSYEI